MIDYKRNDSIRNSLKHPVTEDVLRDYDDILGKCVLCNRLFDSITKIAVDYNLKLNVLE